MHKLEYLWLDGCNPTQIRSKTKIVKSFGRVGGEAAVWGLTIPIRGVSIGGKILAKTLQKTGTKGAKVGKAIEKANVKSAAKWATKPTTKHLGRRR